jgi:hypothetical protein
MSAMKKLQGRAEQFDGEDVIREGERAPVKQVRIALVVGGLQIKRRAQASRTFLAFDPFRRRRIYNYSCETFAGA